MPGSAGLLQPPPPALSHSACQGFSAGVSVQAMAIVTHLGVHVVSWASLLLGPVLSSAGCPVSGCPCCASLAVLCVQASLPSSILFRDASISLKGKATERERELPSARSATDRLSQAEASSRSSTSGQGPKDLGHYQGAGLERWTSAHVRCSKRWQWSHCQLSRG